MSTPSIARLFYSCKTKYDRLLATASSVGEISVLQQHALIVARDIDSRGQAAVDDALALPGSSRPEWAMARAKNGACAAAGHGVDVVYASGRRRLIRN